MVVVLQDSLATMLSSQRRLHTSGKGRELLLWLQGKVSCVTSFVAVWLSYCRPTGVTLPMLNSYIQLPSFVELNYHVRNLSTIAEVTGSNPVEALIFFRLLPSNCLNWKFTAMITLQFYLCSGRMISHKQLTHFDRTDSFHLLTGQWSGRSVLANG